MSQGRPTGVKPAGLGPRLVAGEARDGGGGRNSSSGDQMAGGGHLRDTEDPARRVVRSDMPGAIYIDRGELKGGGRSSGNSGDGAIGHGVAVATATAARSRAHQRAHRAPANPKTPTGAPCHAL